MDFKPPKNILEKICYNTENCLCSWEDILTQKLDFIDTTFPHLSRADNVINKICKFYDVDEKRLHPLFRNVVAEMIDNSFIHVYVPNHPIEIGLYLGDKGVCTGFYDGGRYFKNEKIKETYENKQKLLNFDKRTFNTTSGFAGVMLVLYKNTDFIHVDTNQGVLYCGRLKENLIAPEEKIGARYFR